jgi:hypothetical protein
MKSFLFLCFVRYGIKVFAQIDSGPKVLIGYPETKIKTNTPVFTHDRTVLLAFII